MDIEGPLIIALNPGKNLLLYWNKFKAFVNIAT